MAFIKPAVKLILREDQQYHFSGPVLALGVPEIYATASEITDWMDSLAGRPCPVPLSEMERSTNETGKKLGWISATTFFRVLGLTEVVTVDIPGCEHKPDVVHDLNQPFPSSLLNRFGLILDPGTIEHVFDMKTCLGNVVRALKVGGVVVHQVPVYMYNGGYFSINPNVLHDFYRKNGFSDLKAYIIMWDRYHAYTGTHTCYEYSDEVLGSRHALADSDQCRRSPMMLFFARKTAALPDIVTPLQYEGHYVQGTSTASVSSSLRTLLSRSFNSVLKALPFPVAFTVRARFERIRSLIRSRRHSFKI